MRMEMLLREGKMTKSDTIIVEAASSMKLITHTLKIVKICTSLKMGKQ